MTRIHMIIEPDPSREGFYLLTVDGKTTIISEHAHIGYIIEELIERGDVK